MGFLAISEIIPPASVFPYAGASAPEGWLICNGSAVSRTTYAALFAAIGTTYGSGDGSTTFNLPNTQGVFLRGAGSQTISAISYTGTRGTTQGDQLQGHKHSIDSLGIGYQAGPADGSKGRVDATSPSGLWNYIIGNPNSDGTNGTPRTGTETRPANIAVNYIIKI